MQVGVLCDGINFAISGSMTILRQSFFRCFVACVAILTMWLSSAGAVEQVSCIEVFYPANFRDVSYSEMEDSLATDFQQHSVRFKATERFLGFNSLGQVLFVKKHPFIHWPGRNREMPWMSTKNSIFGTSTPQGDLRSFIGLVSPKLARYFGFEILKLGEESILKAPGAHLLKSLVLRLNRQLKKNKKDPIVYWPVHAGLLNPEEMLRLSISGEGDAVALFAYADDNPKLAGHEVAYHLGEMLFSKQYHQKSREIDLETLRVVNLLRISALPSAEVIAQALMTIRSQELDFGNANILHLLASTRIKEKMPSFDSLFLPEEYLETVKLDIQSLIHPGQTPREAVFEMLMKVLDFKEIDLNSNAGKGRVMLRAVRHPLTDQAKYLQFMQSLQQANIKSDSTQEFERKSAEEYWNEMVLRLDSRIQELIDAFEQIYSQGK